MSDGSVNNSAELTLGINTTPAEQSIEKLEAKLNELVSKLQKLDGNHKVDHVVSPSAVKQIEHLTQQVKILQAELEAVRTGSAKTGGPSGVFANISKEAQELQGVIGAVDKKVARSQHNLQVMLKSAEMAGSASMQSWKTAFTQGQNALAKYNDELERAAQITAKAAAKRAATLDVQSFSNFFSSNRISEAAQAYTGIGKSIFAANEAVKKFGEDSARAMLGQKSYLVDAIGSLDTYRRKVKETADEIGRLGTASIQRSFETRSKLTSRVSAESIERQTGINNGPSAMAEHYLMSGATPSYRPGSYLAAAEAAAEAAHQRELAAAVAATDYAKRSAKGSTSALTQANQAARDATREHREQQAMLHSTLRGVAGGLDNLWLTYGRFIPQMVSAYAAVSAFRKSASEGITFDYQTQFISALGGDRALSSQNIQDQLLGIKDAPANVNELATSLRVLQQTGIDAAEGMGLLSTIISASTLGETTLKVAAEDIVGVLEVFDLHSEDPLQLANNFRKAGDIMAYVAQETKANLHDVASGMQAATGVASQYGISLEFAAASLAALGKQGIVGSKSGTFFRNFVEELYQPKSNKAERALGELGVSAYDSTGKAREALEIIKEMVSKLKEYKAEARDSFVADIFGERGAKQFRAIANDLDAFTAKLKEAGEANGLLSTQTSKLAETTQYQLQQLKSDFDNLFIKTWTDDSLAAPIKALREAVGNADLQNLFRSIVQSVVELGTVIANNIDYVVTFGKALATWLVFQSLHGSIAMLVRGIGLLGPALGAATLAIGGTSMAVQSFAAIAAGTASSIAGGTGIAAALGTLAPVLGTIASLIGPIAIALGVAGAAWYLFRDRTAEALDDSTQRLRTYGAEVSRILEGIERMPAAAARAAADRAAGGLEAKHAELRNEQASIAKRYGLDKRDLAGDFDSNALARKATSSYNIFPVLDALKAKNKEYAEVRDQVLGGLRAASAAEFSDFRIGTNQVNQKIEDKEFADSGTGGKDRVTPPPKGGKGAANKADKDALRANIVEMQGWIRELSQLEKQAQDELATSFNEGTVTATEYWEGRLELANSYTALEIAAIDGLISSQKGLSKSELAQLTAKKKLLEVNLDGGNEAARDRAKSESLSKLKLSYDKVIDSAKKQIALYKNDTVFEALSRQTDEFGRQDLEVERSVEAFRLAEIAKVEALNLANRQNKDLTASQLAGIDAITEAERQALMERLNLKRQHEGNWLNGVDESWKAWKDSANNAAKIAGQSFSTIFKKVDDVMLDFIRTGKLNFKSLGQTIKDEVIKLLYELTVKQFVIGIAGDFSGLAMAIGGTALKSILGVSGSGGSSVGSSGGSTDYLGMASNASTAYSAYGYLSNAYQYGLADTAQGAYYSLANYLNPAPAAGQFTVPTYSQHLADYAASQGADVSAMGTVAEPAGSAATGTLSAGTFLSYVGIAYAITQAISAIATAGGRKPFQYDGLEVKGDYDGKNFTGQAATNWKAKGGWWQNGAQTSVWVPLTDSITDLRAAAERLYGWNTTVIGEGATGGYTYTPIQEANLASLTSSGMGIMSPNPEYAQWLSAYNESNWVGRPDVSEGYYYNGEEKVYAPEKSTYSGFYGPTRVQPISMDPNILGAIDLAIETAFNAPKAAMKKVAETFGDSELVTKIDAFTAKINVSGQTIGEILGKIGTQVTTDLGQAFLPAVEAARVQGAALRTGLETAIANATTAGDTAAVQTLQAQMAAIGIVAAETWNQTFERVLKETDAVTKVMDLLGVSLKDIGDANKVLTLSDNLVTLFGSIDAMNTSINAYYGNFYTEAEKQERAWKGMSETFKSLNLTMPTTREGFRDLVDAQDLTTAAGQQTFVALMNVQGAFANLTPAMDAVVASVTTLIVTAEQLRSAKSSLMGYFNTDQKRMVLTGEISDVAKENGVDLGAESLSNLGNATRTQFAQYVQSVANEGTEASRRMLVALAAIAPIFEDLATLAEDIARADLETAITNTQTAITNTQTAIDDLVTQYGDVTAAMEEINAPAKNLVDTWRGAETELASLQAAFDDLFGGTVQTLIEQARQTAAMRDTFAAGAGNALDAARDARTSAMTPEQRADFWRQQEQSLWQGLGTATDKGAVISQIMSAYANTRSAEFDALEANQSTVQKDALQTQIDAWKTTLSVIEQSKRLVEDIDKTLAGLAYSDLSNLGYTGQLGAASSSYSNTLSKAAAGDVNAMGDLTSIARDYLTEAQTYFGGATLDYSNVYDKVTGDLRGLGVGLNTDGTGAQSEIDRLTASLASLPTDIKNAFDMETADGYGRIAVALDAGTQFNTARLDEQRAQLQTQIDQQKTVIANQEAQIRQQAENHAALMARLIEQNGRLATLESNSNLATVAA